MRKENVIVIFYVLYFSWLFTVAFLMPSINVLNYFTGIVTIFYFVFLREKGDLFWYGLACFLPIFIGITTFDNWQLKFNINLLSHIPTWLLMAWGTTVVSLRKLFLLINSK